MRKKLTICLGLVLLVLLVAVSVVWWMQLADPPLRVGMTEAEVSQVFGEPEYSVGYVHSGKHPYPPAERYKGYPETVDVFGYHRTPKVYFDEDGRVTGWNTEPSGRTRPPWLDQAMKWAGW